MTALMYAAKNLDDEMSCLLISQGANLDIQDINGNTALLHLYKRDKIEDLRFLKNIIGNRKAIENRLKCAGANESLVNNLGECSVLFRVNYIFLEICKKGDLISLNDLLEKDLLDDYDFQGINGRTALIEASEYGNMHIIGKLLELQVNVNYKDKLGNTALMYASMNGYIGSMGLLLENGADINLQNNKLETALIMSKNNLFSVKKLIENKVNLDIQDNYGGTALFYSLFDCDSEVSHELINNGANAELLNNAGQSAFDIAMMSNSYISAYLLKPNSINQQDEDGNTYILNACQEKNEKQILFLYEKGADFNIKNNKGQFAYTVLKRKKVLSPALQGLKEKIILDNSIEDHDLTVNRGI